MKKIYLSCLGFMLCAAVSAQVAVTFNVDMNIVAPTTDSLHLVGNFNDPDYDGTAYPTDYNGAYLNWTPTAISMTDTDLDGIFSVTLNLNPARYEFKFLNGNDWPFIESVPTSCSVSNANGNRQILVTSDANSYTVCYGECALCGENAVRLSVDMATVDLDGDGVFAEPGDDINPAGVYVYDVNTLGFTHLTNFIDHVFETTLSLPSAGDFDYHFSNGNDLAYLETVANDASCGDGAGGRLATIADVNTIVPTACWSLCGPCTLPAMITFQVDMTNSCADTSPGVNLMGTVTNWATGAPMSDDNGDNVWDLTVALAPSSAAYAYKFRIGDNGWEGFGGDRTLVVSIDSILPVVCFGSAEPCGAFNAPADITFQATPGTETIPTGQSLFVMGNFTTPNWQSGALQMDDTDGDGTWSVTVPQVCIQTVNYKYVIALTNTSTTSNWLEETADFTTIGGCGIDNGSFSDNRQIVRTNADPITVCWDFNTCNSCLDIHVAESEVVSNLNVFPVPADDHLTINFNSPKAQTVVLKMFNNLGQVVIQEYLGTVAGQKTITLNTSDLATGIYSIAISNGLNTQSKTISIK